MQITKLDAARRQLLSAIHLQWFMLEPIAAYQLAGNAGEICDKLLKRSGKIRIIEQVERVHGLSPEEAKRLVNSARNFTKHADRDPDGVMDDIRYEDADAVILTACIDYCIISRRSHYIIGMFIAWYAAINPNKTGDFYYEMAEILFPNLASATRAEQVLAARSALAEPMSPNVMHDFRNELTDDWRWSSLRKVGQPLRLPEST